MSCLRAVFFWAGLQFVFLEFTSSGSILLANGSTNQFSVVTSTGAAIVPPGASFSWQAQPGGVTNLIDGSVDLVWTYQDGHEYAANASQTASNVLGVYSYGPAHSAVWDTTQGDTTWFWAGFATTFCAGLIALGGRWVHLIIAGGGDPGGND